ncbi:MAG: hypothetical protein PVF47_11825, partial [Anaerolineae bacterium]
MKRATRLLSHGYRCLLRLYPAPFRTEFAEEMGEVFDRAIADAACRGRGALLRRSLREFGTGPAALGREWSAGLQARLNRKRGTIVADRPSPRDLLSPPVEAGLPVPWPQTLLAALALLVPGLALAGWPNLPAGWHLALTFGSYLFILAGLLAGWIRRFPRWSYPYLGYSLLFPLWLARVATPGFQFLGHSFTPNEIWGWRAWLGLEVVAVLALLWTRSLRPLVRLLAGIWRDWTCLSLALYGTLPFVIWILFDEVHTPYRLPFLIATSLALAAGALAHMQSTTAVRRMASLLAGLTVAWLIGTAGLSAYWHGFRVPGYAPLHWSETALPMALGGLVVAAILLVPAVFHL